MTKIVIQEFGKIAPDSIQPVIETVRECYDRLEPHDVELADLLVFDIPSRMRAHLSQEQNTLGVLTRESGERFYAMHEAWTGIPRMWVCLQTISKLDKLIRDGCLRHEVGHSILHGKPEYYTLPLPPSLYEFSKKMRFSREYMIETLYLLSIAVKDYEVTLLLIRRGYLEDQTAYAKDVLSVSREDITAWQISKGHPTAMALCLLGRLKDITPTIAIGEETRSKKSNQKTIVDELDYLPSDFQALVLETAEKIPAAMGGDTFKNLYRVSQIAVETLLEPLFSVKT